jgi:hypothetical protein
MISNRDIFGHGSGYERKLEETMATLARKEADPLEFRNTSPTNSNIFNEQAEKVEPAIYLTDLMPGVNFHNPVLTPVAALDMNKTITQAPEDPSSSREAHEAAVQNYVKEERAVKNEFINALKETDPGVGASMEKAMGVEGGPSVFVDAMKLADPGVGDLYSALNSLMGRNPDDQRVHAAIDKTLTNLHKQTEQKNELASAGKGLPPKIVWTALKTPQQAMDYLQRDVMKDPLMRQAADNEKIVQQMERNFTNYEDIYTQGKQTVTVNMIEAAGDDQKLKGALLETFAGGNKDKIEGFKTGFTPEEIEARLKLADISGVAVHKVDVSAIDENVKEVAKLAYMPPKLEPANEPQYLLRASMG